MMLQGLKSLRHPNGRPLVELYVDDKIKMATEDNCFPSKQGATFAFNVLRSDGNYVPWAEVEKTANEAKVYIRAGGEHVVMAMVPWLTQGAYERCYTI
jgi:molybdenum cofactor sulfurtransferase